MNGKTVPCLSGDESETREERFVGKSRVLTGHDDDEKSSERPRHIGVYNSKSDISYTSRRTIF